jgi:HEAT repeat protein
VPDLIELLADRQSSSASRTEAAQALGRILAPRIGAEAELSEQRPRAIAALRAALEDPTPNVRQQAAEALGEIRAEEKDVEADLLRATKDDHADVAVAAATALARLGKDSALPALMRSFQGEQAKAADRAGETLIEMGSRSSGIVPQLLPALKGEEGETARARHVLLRLGPIAVPALCAALRDNHDAAIRSAAAEVLGELGPVADQAAQPLLRALKDPDSGVALAAARALAEVEPEQGEPAVPVLVRSVNEPASLKALASLGPRARKAIPELIGCLRHREGVSNPRDIQMGAQQALARIGATAISPLKEALQQRSDGTAARAAMVLGSYGPAAHEAVDALINDLEKDRANGVAYITALGLIGPPARAAIPELKALLSDPALRAPAAAALALIDPEQAPKAVAALQPDLWPSAKFAKQEAMAAALQAMVYVGPAGKEAAPELIALWRLRYPPLTAMVNQAFKSIGPQAVPPLNALLRDEDPALREAAATVLGALGAPADAAVPGLSDLLKTSQPRSVRMVAAMALGEMGEKAAPAVPALIEQTNDWENDPRREAVRALGKIGPKAAEARLALSECLLDANAEIRGLAALALGQVAPREKELAAALEPLRNDPRVQVRFAALQALHRIAPGQKKETVSQLRDLARSPESSIHLPAVEGLADADETAARAFTSTLQHDLTLDDPNLRLRAARVLLRLDPSRTRPTVLALARLLRHPQPVVRREALRVLAGIGSRAVPALPWIVRSLSDENRDIRAAAARALPTIDREAAIGAGVL